MASDLTDRWVVVTGGSSGIGRATAAALARNGASVIGLGRHFEEPSAEGVIELLVDLRDTAKVAVTLAEISALLDGDQLYGLVHCAAVSVVGPSAGIRMEQFSEVFDVNVNAPVAVTQALLTHFGGEGRVVFVGSRASAGAAVLNGPYAASKAAVRSLVSTLRAELAPAGIQVCEVIPGSTRTALRERALAGLGEAIQRAMAVAPTDAYETWADRFRAAPVADTTPEEVADSIVGLLLDDSPASRTYVPAVERVKEYGRYLPPSIGAFGARVRRRFN